MAPRCINPDLGDSIVIQNLPQQKVAVSYYVLDDTVNGGAKTLITITLPDDLLAIPQEQRNELFFQMALIIGRALGRHS